MQFRQVHEGVLVFTEWNYWNSKAGFTQLFWYYSFYSRHSFLIYVLLGNYQLVPAHSVSFRVLQIGQNHFSSHIFINFCLSPQSSVLITIIECNVQAVFHSFLRIQHYTLSWRYYIFLQGWNLLYAELMKIGILLPKLFWLTVRKNCSSDQEQLLKFEAEGREFSKFLRSLEQFIQTVKGQNNFW